MWYTRGMKIRLRYFASIRDIVGQSEEPLMVSDTAQVADVRTLLTERYPQLQPIMERSVNALNHRYVKAETLLHEGDELVFIPPTGGGC
jgi:molybdopterin synthase sulfur carrier subunit